jgi:hypothetical protein
VGSESKGGTEHTGWWASPQSTTKPPRSDGRLLSFSRVAPTLRRARELPEGRLITATCQGRGSRNQRRRMIVSPRRGPVAKDAHRVERRVVRFTSRDAGGALRRRSARCARQPSTGCRTDQSLLPFDRRGQPRPVFGLSARRLPRHAGEQYRRRGLNRLWAFITLQVDLTLAEYSHLLDCEECHLSEAS